MRSVATSIILVFLFGCGATTQGPNQLNPAQGQNDPTLAGDDTPSVEHVGRHPLIEPPEQMADISFYLAPRDDRPRGLYYTEYKSQMYLANVWEPARNSPRPDRWPDDMELYRYLRWAASEFQALVPSVELDEASPDEVEDSKKSAKQATDDLAEILWELNLYFKSSVINTYLDHRPGAFETRRCIGNCPVKSAVQLSRSDAVDAIFKANRSNVRYANTHPFRLESGQGGDVSFWRDAKPFGEHSPMAGEAEVFSAPAYVNYSLKTEGIVRVEARRFDGADYEAVKNYESPHPVALEDKTYFTFDHFEFLENGNVPEIAMIASHLIGADAEKKQLIKAVLKAYTQWLWALNQRGDNNWPWYSGDGIKAVFPMISDRYILFRDYHQNNPGSNPHYQISFNSPHVPEELRPEQTEVCRKNQGYRAKPSVWGERDIKRLLRTAAYYLGECAATDSADPRCEFSAMNATLFWLGQDALDLAMLGGEPCFQVNSLAKAQASVEVTGLGGWQTPGDFDGSASGFVFEGWARAQVEYIQDPAWVRPGKDRDFWHDYRQLEILAKESVGL